MTTKPRIIVPDHFFHVYSEGISATNIFKDDNLKAFFLKELSLSLQKFSFKCFAWSIMNNHYHLVIKSSSNSLSRFMQRLNSTYAKEFNKRNHHHGAVFSKRFSSIVVQNGNFLNELIRHIHLNPVRKGYCTIEELDKYQWCGHRALVNDISDSITNNIETLKLFGDSDFIVEYKKFIHSTCKKSQAVNMMRLSNRGNLSFYKSNCFIIGDKSFTAKVIELDKIRRARVAKYVKENLTLDGILDKVGACVKFGSRCNILRQGRLNERSTARQLFALIGHCDYDFSCTDIANYFKITTSAVSTMISRVKRIEGLHFLKDIIYAFQMVT